MLAAPNSENCLQLSPRARRHSSLEQGTNLRGNLRGRLVRGDADERWMGNSNIGFTERIAVLCLCSCQFQADNQAT